MIAPHDFLHSKYTFVSLFLYNYKDDLYFQLFRYWKYLEDESKFATDKVSLVGIMKQDVEDIWCQVNHSTDLHASKPLISAASGIVYHVPLYIPLSI